MTEKNFVRPKMSRMCLFFVVIAAPPSPKSLTPTSSARFGVLAAIPPSRVVNMVNKQQELAEVRGEDDSRGPPR